MLYEVITQLEDATNARIAQMPVEPGQHADGGQRPQLQHQLKAAADENRPGQRQHRLVEAWRGEQGHADVV